MINNIILKNVATYEKDTETIIKPSKINFIYGNNGTCKTTITRVIENPDKYEEYGNQSLEKLTKELDKNNSFIKMENVYTSEKLSNIAFMVLEQITKNYNLPIKKCQHFGRYFMPSIRQDELYCDLPNEDGKSCREKGAKQTYKEKLEKDPVLQEYRKAYQKKFMEVSRSNGDKQKKEDFEEWKTIIQDMLKNYKENKEDNKLTEKILKWIDESK